MAKRLYASGTLFDTASRIFSRRGIAMSESPSSYRVSDTRWSFHGRTLGTTDPTKGAVANVAANYTYSSDDPVTIKAQITFSLPHSEARRYYRDFAVTDDADDDRLRIRAELDRCFADYHSRLYRIIG